MSKYSDEYDDSHAICPYCQYKNHVEGEDYNEDSRVEECASCGKQYHQNEYFSVSHETTPDCELNKQSHTFEAAPSKQYPNTVFIKCSTCGKLEIVDLVAERLL